MQLVSLAVISDRQRRANIHRALRGGCFLRCFGLFKEVHASFIAVVRYEIRRFFETETTQRAAGIHIPLSGRVLRLFAQFVAMRFNKRTAGSQSRSSFPWWDRKASAHNRYIARLDGDHVSWAWGNRDARQRGNPERICQNFEFWR